MDAIFSLRLILAGATEINAFSNFHRRLWNNFFELWRNTQSNFRNVEALFNNRVPVDLFHGLQNKTDRFKSIF